MVYGSENEKPLSKRTRIVLVLLSWLIIGIPLFVGLWFWFGWWVLVLFAGAVWATFDYMKRGDMFSSIDHMMSHHIRTGEDGESRFGVDD